jgi:hypothetical protein
MLDKCVRFPAEKTREFVAPTDAGCHTEKLLARERGRLARQLHDEVASAMFAAKIELDVASRLAETGAPEGELRATLQDATRSANEAMSAIRIICADLREFGGEAIDIFGDLTGLLRDFERKTGAQCLLTIRCDCSAIEMEAAKRILRAVRGKLDAMVSSPGVKVLRVDLCANERHYALKIRFDTMAESPERTIGGNSLTHEFALESPGPPETSKAGAPAAMRKSIVTVRIPRDFKPESNGLPSPHP